MTILLEDEAYDLRMGPLRHLLWLPLVGGERSEITPRLAESWEHSPDYRTWTFRLREDVRWHDGVPVTAHDVAFNLEMLAHPDVLFPALWVTIDSISVPDDHTITLALAKPAFGPVFGPPFGGWVVYLPRHLLQDLDPADFYQSDFWTRPVGNGPYRFVRRVPQTMLELESNPDFYAGEPLIERIVIKFSSASRVIELTSGASDVAFDLGLTAVLKLEADPRFDVRYWYDWSELQAIYWNQSHPLFADGTVRLALSHAIDRRELARLLNFPDEMPLAGGLRNEEADPFRRRGWDQGATYDPEAAERLLEQSGWIDRDGDGIRERAGREARFTLLVPRGAYVPGETLGIFVQSQLQRVGVAVEIRAVEWAAAQDAWRAGDYEAMVNWVETPPRDILDTWFEGSPFGYYDEEAVQLLKILEAELDPEAQDTLYARIDEIFRRDMPVTFLFPLVVNYVAHRRIRGFRPGWSVLGNAEELWIDPDWEKRAVEEGGS